MTLKEKIMLNKFRFYLVKNKLDREFVFLFLNLLNLIKVKTGILIKKVKIIIIIQSYILPLSLWHPHKIRF